MHASSLGKLEKLSLDELIKMYDQQAGSTVIGLNFLRQEIEWRHQREGAKNIEKMTEQMRDMTRDIKWMTVGVVVLTIINLAVAVISLVK